MPKGVYDHSRTKHGSITHGHSIGKRSPTYSSWRSMISRCRLSKYYVEHRIMVCERWLHSFPNFLSDMGERPQGTTIDRYPDNYGDYEPSNCRWATDAEQRSNRRDNVILEHNGVKRTVKEWADVLGVSEFALYKRIYRGWSPQKVIETPMDYSHAQRRKS